MLFRRLDDKIGELCAWALASEDLAELHEIVTQLRAALQEHTTPSGAWSTLPNRNGGLVSFRAVNL
jgi:hypothetical protein